MIKLASKTRIKNPLSPHQLLPYIIQPLLVPHLIVKKVLIIDHLHQLGHNLHPLQVAQLQLNLAKKHSPHTAGFRLVVLLEAIA
jgi:hypothetical protein